MQSALLDFSAIQLAVNNSYTVQHFCGYALRKSSEIQLHYASKVARPIQPEKAVQLVLSWEQLSHLECQSQQLISVVKRGSPLAPYI